MAFTVGSYDHVTEEVRVMNAKSFLWIVTDMDEGTSFILKNGSHGLGASMRDGLVFITSIDLEDENSSLMFIGKLPIKIPMSSTVQFTCARGKFIYLYDRQK